ncbi:hypothetical protein AWF31_18980 [Escherichia coli]|nr:hypothetical protein AWF76_13450 [Escherichia coli]KVI13641.1 hypothetical protein AWF31_18980 [Escherichia coli]
MEGRDFIAVELGAHLIDFFAPDAMFPTDAAANFNAEFEDLPAQFFRAGKFTGFVGIAALLITTRPSW